MSRPLNPPRKTFAARQAFKRLRIAIDDATLVRWADDIDGGRARFFRYIEPGIADWRVDHLGVGVLVRYNREVRLIITVLKSSETPRFRNMAGRPKLRRAKAARYDFDLDLDDSWELTRPVRRSVPYFLAEAGW